MNKLFARQSIIGYIIKIAGVVVMAWGLFQGIFSSVMMAQMGGHYNEFGDWQYAGGITSAALFSFLGFVGTHFVYGLLIIGFGEVIDTLQKIYFRMDPEAKQQWEEEQKEKEMAVSEGGAPFWVQKEVKGYYDGKKETVHSIEKTNDSYVFKIAVDDRIEYMEVGNAEPRILTDEEIAKFIQ